MRYTTLVSTSPSPAFRPSRAVPSPLAARELAAAHAAARAQMDAGVWLQLARSVAVADLPARQADAPPRESALRARLELSADRGGRRRQTGWTPRTAAHRREAQRARCRRPFQPLRFATESESPAEPRLEDRSRSRRSNPPGAARATPSKFSVFCRLRTQPKCFSV